MWGQGRPRPAWSSWLIFPVSIDPAASPESISSQRVKISPIASPDLRQGGSIAICSNRGERFPLICIPIYSRREGGQGGRLSPGMVRAVLLGPLCQPGWQLVLPVSLWQAPMRRRGREGGRPSRLSSMPCSAGEQVVDVVFTKHKAARSGPLPSEHGRLCRVGAHTARGCQALGRAEQGGGRSCRGCGEAGTP